MASGSSSSRRRDRPIAELVGPQDRMPEPAQRRVQPRLARPIEHVLRHAATVHAGAGPRDRRFVRHPGSHRRPVPSGAGAATAGPSTPDRGTHILSKPQPGATRGGRAQPVEDRPGAVERRCAPGDRLCDARRPRRARPPGAAHGLAAAEPRVRRGRYRGGCGDRRGCRRLPPDARSRGCCLPPASSCSSPAMRCGRSSSCWASHRSPRSPTSHTCSATRCSSSRSSWRSAAAFGAATAPDSWMARSSPRPARSSAGSCWCGPCWTPRSTRSRSS